MNILIVEDDRIQAYKLKIDLHELGLTNIDIAHTCKDALKHFRAKDYDLIFCDISLPDEDGIYFIEKISFKSRKLHLVLLSYADSKVLNLIEKVANVLDFKKTTRIDKPYSLSDLQMVTCSKDVSTRPKVEQIVSYHFTESEIVDAINAGEFTVYFQPQVSISCGKIESVEALTRWRHKELGLLNAGAFIDSVVTDRALFLLFEHALEQSLEQLTQLSHSVGLSINVTYKDIQSPNFYSVIVDQCSRYQLPYERMTLELTESHLYLASKQALVTLARLKLLGIRLSIDDLGSGYSSLVKLTQIPFDEIKIDKAFINGICQNYQKTTIVQLLVNLAKQLDLRCIAEGVEDQETLEFVRTLGVDVSQGYYTGKPVNLRELERNLSVRSDPLEQQSVDCLVIDDHTIVTAALEQALQQCNFISSVSSCSTIKQAIRKLSTRDYNLLLVDIKLGDESGFTIIDHLNKIGYDGGYIFMSGGTNPTYPYLSREKGALGYLDKALEVGDFIQELSRMVSSKGSAYSGNNLKKVTSNPMSLLSKREFEVLHLLVQGVSNKMIASQLDLSEKTVSTYKSRLLDKLDCKSILDVSRNFF